MNLYQAIQPLNDEQRIEARARAAAIVAKTVGDRPRREMFANTQVSRYPAWFTRMIAALLAVVFVAAAMPSLFRLFTAGRDYFLSGISDQLQASIVGISTFMLAEFLIILSTISARVYFTGRGRWVFVVPVGMGLTMALVGNWTVVHPHDIFSVLEATIPVATVLFVALIGERLILEAIETRHANEHAYQLALADWQVAASTPEQHPRYMSALANALRDELRSSNARGKGAAARGELMSSFTNEHWKALVIRELAADDWYSGDSGSTLPTPPALPTPRNNSQPSEVEPQAEPPRPFGNIRRVEAWEGPVSIQMKQPLIVSANGVSTNGNGKS